MVQVVNNFIIETISSLFIKTQQTKCIFMWYENVNVIKNEKKKLKQKMKTIKKWE